MQSGNFSEQEYLSVGKVLAEGPSLYTQIILGLVGVIAAMAAFAVSAL